MDLTAAGGQAGTVAPAESTDVYATFLDEMDELGLLHDLEDELPPDFSAVFEIGRVIAAESSAIGRAVSPALELRQAAAGVEERPADVPDSEGRITVPAAEEYEAEFIRSWSDAQWVYSWQWLLPEEVFLRRLAQRQLWFPMAKAPRILAIDAGGDGYEPTPAKQKAYLLFDTSASMALHHRFALAKAVVLRFLRTNRRELGEVFLRTFDVDVGPLEIANDASGYDELVRRVARRRTLGNGTCLERAILTACRDIRDRRSLAGAEILVVTDGAAHVDAFVLREALGRDIELHCVKIGSVTVSPTAQYLDDQLDFSRSDHTRREQKILNLRARTERLQQALRFAPDESTRATIRAGLRECAEERAVIAGELREEYGHEIEHLADVYVQVPDVDPSALALTPEQLASLERLVAEMLDRLRVAPVPPDLMKQAALLLSHVAMLQAEQSDPAARERLDGLRRSLEAELTSAIEHHEARVLDAGLLSPSDQRDLRILLRRGVTRYSSLWLALLRYFYAFVSRFRWR